MKSHKTIKSRTSLITVVDDVVIKKMRDIEKAPDEAERLKRLGSLLKEERDIDGWRYDCAKLLKVELTTGRLFMTRASGISLAQELSASRAYRAGRWLAAFQEGGRTSDGRVPVFGDFGPNHVFIDGTSKAVTVIDPGAEIGTRGSIETDVGYMLSSLVLYSLRRRRNPWRIGRAFVDGVLTSRTGSIRRQRLREVLSDARRQTERRWKRKLPYGTTIFAIVPYRIIDRFVTASLLWTLSLSEMSSDETTMPTDVT